MTSAAQPCLALRRVHSVPGAASEVKAHSGPRTPAPDRRSTTPTGRPDQRSTVPPGPGDMACLHGPSLSFPLSRLFFFF